MARLSESNDYSAVVPQGDPPYMEPSVYSDVYPQQPGYTPAYHYLQALPGKEPRVTSMPQEQAPSPPMMYNIV